MRVGVRAALGAVLLPLLLACTPQPEPVAQDTSAVVDRRPGGAVPQVWQAGRRLHPDRTPNIVLVLLDDFSLDLLPTMAEALDMRRDGASWEHSYVVDSLCCVSRSSLLTGQYPHQTGVRTNTANTPNSVGPLGGWEAFAAYGNAERAVNLRLQQAGWTTGYVGKFLNQYEYVPGVTPPLVPGWTEWQPVFSNAYDGWDFDLMDADATGVTIEHVDAPPEWASDREKDAAYAGTVIADRAVAFVEEHRDDPAPYFLTVAPYGTHSRIGPLGHYAGDPGFPPAFRDRPALGRPGNCGPVACTSLGADDLPGFGDDLADNVPARADGSPAPQWRPGDDPVTAPEAAATLRSRAQMAQSVDRMLGRLRDAVGPDTYVVLTSDNGFHIGQHGLARGKGTPFASDVRVPLLVTGPGVTPGPRDAVVSNLDLAPTLERLAGLRPAPYRSGTSLAASLADPDADRRRFTFFEHTWAPSLGSDPDAAYAGGSMDLILSYVAVRGRSGLLVRLDLDPTWDGVDTAWEFYDYDEVGWERTNGYGDRAHRLEVARLTDRLERFEGCRGFTGDDVVPDACRELTR